LLPTAETSLFGGGVLVAPVAIGSVMGQRHCHSIDRVSLLGWLQVEQAIWRRQKRGR